MNVGDLVRHKSDGAVGMVVAEPFSAGFGRLVGSKVSSCHVPVLFEGQVETPLNLELEVISEV